MIGLGKSGIAAARFLRSRGAKVRVTDGSDRAEVIRAAEALRKRGIRTETGAHSREFLKGVELIVTSPGVPKKSLPFRYARRRSIPVISEIELAWQHCRGPVIAVTGSNGKTTTCRLIRAALQSARRAHVLCGNIGISFLSTLPRIRAGTHVILEVSSFQLEDCLRFRPHVAIVLNVSANHLDRHGTMAAYRRAKERIFVNQTGRDIVILNYDRPEVRAMAHKARSRVVFFSKGPLATELNGAYVKDDKIRVRLNGKDRVLMDAADLHLKGSHNLENILAAAAAALSLGVAPGDAARAFGGFKTLAHRIEPVGTVRGVDFYNDSKSTTVESTRAALSAMDRPVILIAGGRDKNVSFEDIEPLIKTKVRKAVLYGESAAKIRRAWRNFANTAVIPDFEDAVRRARRDARAGEAVLLSPMCTSFDQFSSYEDRGNCFKRLVARMRREAR